MLLVRSSWEMGGGGQTKDTIHKVKLCILAHVYLNVGESVLFRAITVIFLVAPCLSVHSPHRRNDWGDFVLIDSSFGIDTIRTCSTLPIVVFLLLVITVEVASQQERFHVVPPPPPPTLTPPPPSFQVVLVRLWQVL